MGSLAHKNQGKNISGATPETLHIPEYARGYKREWQYIRGINKTCGIFFKKLEKIDFSGRQGELKAEDIFDGGMSASIIKNINKIMKAQEIGKFKKIRYLRLRQEDYEEIIELVFKLYGLVGHLCIIESFTDFFDKFITFYFICIKFIEPILTYSNVEVEINFSDSDSDSDSD